MSSTNRGYSRHKSDYYVTPINSIEKFLVEFSKYEPSAFSGGVILDPSAGGDEFNLMSYPAAIHNIFNREVKTIDLREDSRADYIGNFLDVDLNYKPKVIITNPPFNIAESMIRKSFKVIEEDGWIIMLLRLNYFESKQRFDGLWKDIGLPKYTFVYHNRLSFTSDGKSDSIAHCHMVWKKGERVDFTKLKVI